MKFNTVSMVKHPTAAVWRVMRDDLPALAPHMADIGSIRVESVRQNGDDIKQIVNLWEARPRLPLNLSNPLPADLFTWRDHAEWHETAKECRWSIEHPTFRDSFTCAGVTRFQPAMGGRGTRMTFSGTFDLNRQHLPKGLGVLGGPTLQMVESMLIKLIPKNFQKISTAIDAHLKSTAAGGDG
jgi:hypothetical protein